jgi:hypothetical protein
LFICNFSHCTHWLTILTCKGYPFDFSPKQIDAQEDLKIAMKTLPALHPIDYGSLSPVILVVDTLPIAVSFHLCQCDINNPWKRYYVQFRLITLNDRESHFSQSRLELYGLFCAFQSLKLYLIGMHNLIAKVDARYINGML